MTAPETPTPADRAHTDGWHEGGPTASQHSANGPPSMTDTSGLVEAVAPERRIYVASRASKPDHPKRWRLFREAGWPIISTWIDEAGEGETACLGELWRRIEREVTTATALILHVEPDDFPLKGAFVEVGMALAAGVPIGVVAPGVELEPGSCRPIGSWMNHPLVRVYPTLLAAFDAATTGRLAGARAAHTSALSSSSLQIAELTRERGLTYEAGLEAGRTEGLIVKAELEAAEARIQELEGALREARSLAGLQAELDAIRGLPNRTEAIGNYQGQIVAIKARIDAILSARSLLTEVKS